MKLTLRKIFKNLLKLQVKFYLKKNNIKVIAIMGWSGTEICKEAIYSIFSKREKVSKIINPNLKDIDLALEIIGIKDIPNHRISVFFKTFFVFFKNIFVKSNINLIVLDLNTSDMNTMKYWIKLIHPNEEVFLNLKTGFQGAGELLLDRIDSKGKVIANRDNRNVYSLILRSKNEKFTYGNNIKSDQVWEKKNNNCIIRFEEDEVVFPSTFPDHALEPLMAAITVGIVKGISIHNCIESLKGFQLPADKVQTQLYKFYD